METLKALEQRCDDVITERKQSKMQTLGASNPYNNKDKHRETVQHIFSNGGAALALTTDDETSSASGGRDSTATALRVGISFKERPAVAMASPGAEESSVSSSTTSKL